MKDGVDVVDKKCGNCHQENRPAASAVRVLSDSADEMCLFCKKFGHQVLDCDDVPREMNGQKPTFCIYCDSDQHELDACLEFVEGIRRVNSASFTAVHYAKLAPATSPEPVTVTLPAAPVSFRIYEDMEDSEDEGDFQAQAIAERIKNIKIETESSEGEKPCLLLASAEDCVGGTRTESMSETSLSSESERQPDAERREESWLGQWIKNSNARETWVNIHRLTDKHAKFQIQEFKISRRIPAACPRLYHLLLRKIQMLWNHQNTVKEDSNEFRKVQVWAADDSLIYTLALLERKFGRHPFSVWKARMLQVFNEELPGYRWTIEAAISNKIRGRYGVYRHLTDFHSDLLRARFVISEWPSGWNPRSWVLASSEGDGSKSVPHAAYSGTELHPRVVLAELKTGTFCGETIGAGLPVEFFERQEIVLPCRDENVGFDSAVPAFDSSILARRLININNGLSDENLSEKYQVLEVVECWFWYLDQWIPNMGLTLTRLLEKTWFRVHVWEHRFVQELLHVFDVRHELQENPENPDVAHLFGRAQRWYASSLFFVGLADLKVVAGDAKATFLNFVTEVLGGGFDGLLKHARMNRQPRFTRNRCAHPEEENDLNSRNQSEPLCQSSTSRGKPTMESSSESGSTSESKTSPTSVAGRETVVGRAFKGDFSGLDKTTRERLENQGSRVILSVELVVKPISKMLEVPLVLGSLFCYNCKNERCELGTKMPAETLKIMVSEQKTLDENEEVTKWIHRFRPDELWINGSWSLTSMDLFRTDMHRVNDEDPYQYLAPHSPQKGRPRLRNRTSSRNGREWGVTCAELEGTEWLAGAMRMQGELYDKSIGIRLEFTKSERKRVLQILLARVCEACTDGLPDINGRFSCHQLKWLAEQTEAPGGRKTTLVGMRWGRKTDHKKAD